MGLKTSVGLGLGKSFVYITV